MPDDKDKVEIWPSNKIRYAYLGTNYYKTTGTLGSSCMRGKDNQKALNFYVKNNVKIAVIVTKDNKIKARALLWENVNVIGKKKTYTYLDRVYYSEEKQKEVYLQFAKDNKFLTYPKQSGVYIKSINLTNITHLPYTDTFRVLYYENKILTKEYVSSLNNVPLKEYVELCSTGNGGYARCLDKNAVKEIFTNMWVSKKDCTYIKKYEAYVLKRNITSINNVYYSIHDIKNIHTLENNKYCLKENVVKEYETKSEIDKTKAKFIDKYDSYVNEDNIIYVNKVIYSKHDKEIVQYKDKYYLISKCYKNIILDKHIPKDKAIIAYKLGFIVRKAKNKEIVEIKDFSSEVYGVDNLNEEISTEVCSGKAPNFIGPYYIDESCPYVVLNTGEYIIKDGLNIKYLIRRNKKYYLRHLHEFKVKKQLLLFK